MIVLEILEEGMYFKCVNECGGDDCVMVHS